MGQKYKQFSKNANERGNKSVKKRGENSLALTPFHEFILVYCGVVGLVGWGFGGMVALDGWKRTKSREAGM